MRIFGKIMAVPAFAALKTVGIIIEILAKLSCVLAGPFLVFVIGCGIYCAVRADWRGLIILAAVAGACVAFYLLIGLLLGAIDIAGSRMRQFIRS